MKNKRQLWLSLSILSLILGSSNLTAAEKNLGVFISVENRTEYNIKLISKVKNIDPDNKTPAPNSYNWVD